jgi:hypothetical protein
MKGTLHLIHKLDNLWIFKTYTKIGKDLIPMRYTFITDGGKSYEDNQEIIGQVVMKEGVEFIREKP